MADLVMSISFIGGVFLLLWAFLSRQPFVFFIGMSVINFFIFAVDKFLAVKHRQRVPEFFLFFLSFCGGAVGGIIAILVFKHKIKKNLFLLPIILMFIAQLILLFIAFR